MAEREVNRGTDVRGSLFQVNRPSPSMPVDQRIEFLATEINRTLGFLSDAITDIQNRLTRLEQPQKK